MIIEGNLADVDGVRPGRIRIDGGVIVDVGDVPGRPDFVFGEDSLVFEIGRAHV